MRERLQRWQWAALACLASLVPVANGFTNSAIFYARDLASYHWPYHHWLRRTVWSGHLPLWNDQVACGYGAIADPALLLLLPTLPLRLLLPETIGFNLAVISFIPVAALGTYRLLERTASRPAAALGAIVFASSGCLLSAANTGTAWSMALVPWVVAGVNGVVARGSARSVAALALAFALQAIVGEPMTLLATATLSVAVAAFGERPDDAGWAARGRSVATVLAAGALGAAIASFMLLPLAEAVGRSERVAGETLTLWEIAPAAFAEALLPRVYGSPLEPAGTLLGWYQLFNEGREPLFFSIYLGLPAVLLAVTGATAGPNRRRAVFWGTVVVAAVVATLGSYTPVYPILQKVVPLMSTFRFPSKFWVFIPLSVAVLAAGGWDALGRKGSPVRPALLAAGLLGAVLAGVLVWIYATDAVAMLTQIAAAVEMPNPGVHATRLVARLGVTIVPALGLTALTGLGVWYCSAGRPRASLVRAGIFGRVALDQVAPQPPLQTTLDVGVLARPAWAERLGERPEERLFVSPYSNLVFAPIPSPSVPDRSPLVSSAMKSTAFPSQTMLWDVRSVMTPDVPQLMSREYSQLVVRFNSATQVERLRFLQRAYVRYYLVPTLPEADAVRLGPAEGYGFGLRLFERPGYSPRVEVVPSHVVMPALDNQILLLFSDQHDPSREAILAAEPPPAAGAASAPQPAAARIVTAGPNAMTVEADVPEGGGFLVLRDTYDPNWRAVVDGQEAAIIRANAVFRAVRLEPGSHRVELAYRPRLLEIGAIVSLVALAVALATLVWPRRRPFISNSSSPS
jgi:hypothetical protein